MAPKSGEIPDVTTLGATSGMDARGRGGLAALRTSAEVPAAASFAVAVGSALAVTQQTDPDGWTVTAHVPSNLGADPKSPLALAGVGCVAMHPTLPLVAVGGKTANPVIALYDVAGAACETWSLRSVLRGGAERSIAALAWSADGEKLASVAGLPDYTLTIWDWRESRTVLRTKAFGQDVYRVKFAPHDSGRLVTSGVGHIRFWKMAATFTGLKLQGMIGKFGKIELSDVEAFAELPDGKVISSTESGHLLLWEGNFIKARFTKLLVTTKTEVGEDGEEPVTTLVASTTNEPDAHGTAPHGGPVNAVELMLPAADAADAGADGVIVSGGADGVVAWWSLAVVTDAEVDVDVSTDFGLAPLHTATIPGCNVRSVVLAEDLQGPYLAVQDANGAMWRLPCAAGGMAPAYGDDSDDAVARPATLLTRFHAGGIAALGVCPSALRALTAGADGSVRCYDAATASLLYSTPHAAAATSAVWLPASAEPSGRVALVGFADGVVRAFASGASAWTRLATFKPSSVAVTALACSADGTRVAAGSADGTIFFMKTPPPMADGASGEALQYEPTCFVNAPAPAAPDPHKGDPSPAVVSLDFRPDGNGLLGASRGGAVFEVDLSALNAPGGVDTSASFEVDLPTELYDTLQLVPDEAPVVDDSPGAQEPSSPTKGGGDASAPDAATAPEGVDAAPKMSPPCFAAAYVAGAPTKAVVSLGGKCNGSYQVALGDSAVAGLTGAAAAIAAAAARVPLPLGDAASSMTAAVATAVAYCVPTAGAAKATPFLVCGGADGSVSVRTAAVPQWFARCQPHDSINAEVTGCAVTYDGAYLVSVGEDGLFASHALDAPGLAKAAEAADAGAGAKAAEATAEAVAAATAEAEAAAAAAAEAEAAAAAAAEAVCVDGPEAALAIPADITDPSSYSIQDSKLKQEEDNLKNAAERKKDAVRRVVAKMAEEFSALRAENEALAAQAGGTAALGDDEFIVDAEYVSLLHQEGEKMLGEVRLECAYESEQAERLLGKLQKKFLAEVDVEAITLKAIKAKHQVSTFRTSRLTPQLRETLDKVHAVMHGEALIRDAKTQAAAAENAGPGGHKQKSAMLAGIDADAIDTELAPGTAPSGKKVSTFEQRKKMRAARKEALRELEQQKPAEDADDPRDVRAIAQSVANTGDYKLKSSENYALGEDERVDAERKRRQMVMLEENVYQIRMRFNRRFLRLRKLKRQIVDGVLEGNARLLQIAGELGDGHTGLPFVPQLDPLEWPSERHLFTDAELDQYRLDVEADPLAPPPKISIVPPGAGPGPAPGGGDGPGAADVGGVAASPYAAVVPALALAAKYEVAYRTESTAAAAKRGSKTAPTPTSEELAVRRTLLLNERAAVMAKAEASIVEFDQAVYDLYKERVLLATDLGAAELRLLVQLQELGMLRLFEARDSALAAKLDKAQKDKGEVMANMADTQSKLKSKMAELKQWTNKDLAVLEAFNVLVSEGHVFRVQLMKIFKRKVKRAKKRAAGDDEDDEDDEDDDDYDDDDDDLDDDDDDEEADDSCPPGCDTSLYEQVLEMREKRLDQDEEIAEFTKNVEELKRTADRHAAREKQIDKDLSGSENEIRSFQTEKQLKLNQLLVTVPLKFSQLRCFDVPELGEGDNGGDDATADADDADVDGGDGGGGGGDAGAGSPAATAATGATGEGNEAAAADAMARKGTELVNELGFQTHVLFSQKKLERLRARIGELKAENKGHRVAFKELHKARGRLSRDKTASEARIATLHAKCNDMQMLKFGQMINIAKLDSSATAGTAEEELADKTSTLEAKQFNELHRLQKLTGLTKEELLNVTRENTELLSRIAELSARQFQLEKELNSSASGGAGVADNGPMVRREVEERNRLVALVKLQAKEVDALKAEINLLRRKGGHVYQPVLPAGTATQGSMGGTGTAGSMGMGMDAPPTAGSLGDEGQGVEP